MWWYRQTRSASFRNRSSILLAVLTFLDRPPGGGQNPNVSSVNLHNRSKHAKDIVNHPGSRHLGFHDVLRAGTSDPGSAESSNASCRREPDGQTQPEGHRSLGTSSADRNAGAGQQRSPF